MCTSVGLIVFVIALTSLFLAMRAVMGIGGSCATGGPYVVANQCPRGVGWIAPVSIWVGLGAAFVYAIFVRLLPGPKWVSLMWPALFLSLGWNFMEFGLAGDASSGDVIGWLVCGVVFIIMGGAPLWFVLGNAELRRWTFWGDAVGRAPDRAVRSTIRDALDESPVVARRRGRGVTDGDGARRKGSSRSDVVDDLERLAALHRAGDLDARQFEAAKQLLLERHGQR
jgi:hypothetical protein